jgi:2-keto-3-deoxy-L-rhamnonate aldolase RhmA
MAGFKMSHRQNDHKVSCNMQEAMESGRTAFGVLVRQARTVDLGRAMVTAGADWLFLDLEHNSMSLDTAVQLSIAAHDAGISPLIRVPAGEYSLACRLLDGGALGIVMPHVDTKEQAAALVSACRYPTLGRRSLAGSLPQVGFRNLPAREAMEEIDRVISLYPMVESLEGARNCQDIAATPGVTGILLGIGDLAIDLGVPGDLEHGSVQEVVHDCIAACRQHNKWIGIGGVGDMAVLKRYIDKGLNFALIGNDLAILMAGVTSRISALR